MESITPEGYRLAKLFYSSSQAAMYEAVRVSDNRPVLLKVYTHGGPFDAALVARREYHTLRRVEGDGIPTVLDLATHGEQPVLVLGRVSGLPLRHWLTQGPMDFERWFEIAVRASRVLEWIHSHRILHLDLSPLNVLFDRSRSLVWICDFGLAVELGAPIQLSAPLGPKIEQDLRYIAPEQTGRMNRGCDFRSDLYSLGAILYHALTGRPPFETRDALEMVHAHLARIPESPSAVRVDVPPAVSRILLKLLAKEPLERYQSASVLGDDLTAASEEFSERGWIADDFVLGRSQARSCPRFPARIFGREMEVARIRAQYDAVTEGKPQLLWLHGPAGSGKSTLVEELRPRIAETAGHMIVGKFDAYADQPYSAWICAISSLVHQLLVESDERLDRWRTLLSRGIGPISGAIIEIVPDLRFILGEPGPLSPLPSREAQARLGLALRRLVASCAKPEHPLVIVLDDLQWMDDGSRALLHQLLEAPPLALYLIGAYRNLDADPPCPPSTELSTEHVEVERISLGPLPPDAFVELLADTLERTPEAAAELADFVGDRTGYSPALARDFVEHLHQQGLLHHSTDDGWHWEMERVRALELPDSAVELMGLKLDRLDAGSRSVIDLASCVGDQFDVELLRELSGMGSSSIAEAVHAITELGLVIPSSRGFRFAHDRIRESAQSRLSADARSRIHGDVARLLLERVADPVGSARAAEIVEHLNQVLELPSELRAVTLRLNLEVARRVMRVGAAEQGSVHLSVARDLLRLVSADVREALFLEVQLLSAECSSQLREFDAALGHLDAIDQERLPPLAYAQLEAKRVQVLALCRSAEICIGHVLRVMRRFGRRWPRHPSRLRAQLSLWWVKRRLLRVPDLEALPPARSSSPKRVCFLMVNRAAAASLARFDVHLAVLATCEAMSAQLHAGYLTPPGFTYAVYATYLYLFLRDRETAERVAQAALVTSERMADVTAPRTRMMVEVLLHPFWRSRRAAVASVDQISNCALESGDLEFAHYARFNRACYLALSGDPISDLTNEFTALLGQARNSDQWTLDIRHCRLAFELLSSETTTRTQIEERHREWMARLEAGAAFNGVASTVWLLGLCFLGCFEAAYHLSERFHAEFFKTSPFVHVVDYAFYRGLSSAVLASAARGRMRRSYLRVVRQSERFVGQCAKDGPDFVHMRELLRAEQARLAGSSAQARVLYEAAAQRAVDVGYPHHAALACERHADLVCTLRSELDAIPIRKRTIRLYEKWGARAKVADLCERASNQGTRSAP